jgi:hypothetical protein
MMFDFFQKFYTTTYSPNVFKMEKKQQHYLKICTK